MPTLETVLAALQRVAPLELAAEWDNTGLLIEPRGRRRRVGRIVLCIDLAERVAIEAERAGADLVVAYHPTIFQPLRRLDIGDGKQRAVLHAARAGFAVYSPHTALDAVDGGIADWLADGVLAGDEAKERRPCGDGDYGRVVELPRAIPLSRLLQRMKRALRQKHLQVARPDTGPSSVRRVAVAAGAGGSILRGEAADVFVTGEMSHHEALAAVATGTSVVLAGHSNTERGYLPLLRRRLRRELGAEVDIRIARSDRDPFAIV
ncbi:MAG: Nif3-like dinuclear metal center hexameric protein [Planctomycetes bacterium]|nr:Nif3-like dinuclear metal center hexameric protein [Planctomycetota bacterium]